MPDNITHLCFVDTNIWLYAFIEANDANKSALARKLLQEIEPVISSQVINEVSVNLLRKAHFPEEQFGNWSNRSLKNTLSSKPVKLFFYQPRTSVKGIPCHIGIV